jgi:hypothetical protein
MRPLAIELFAGLHGWGAGLAAVGFRVVGFDIVDMPKLLGQPTPEHCSLVLHDVLTLHGSQFRNASLIVASPPCQEFSFKAQPWKVGRAKHPKVVGVPTPLWWALPEPTMSAEQLAEWEKWKRDYPAAPPSTALFDACFRIQREASKAAGRHIPIVVENVRGAQPWVGQAKASYGSYYLWGDIGVANAQIVCGDPRFGRFLPVPRRGKKNSGGSWFNVAHNTESGVGANPVTLPAEHMGQNHEADGGSFQSAVKVAGLANGRFPPGGLAQGFIDSGVKQGGSGAEWFDDALNERRREATATKTVGHLNKLDGHGHTRHLTNQAEHVKVSGDWFGDYAAMKANGTISPGRMHGKGSPARRAASALIARIPFPLAKFVGECYYPLVREDIA